METLGLIIRLILFSLSFGTALGGVFTLIFWIILDSIDLTYMTFEITTIENHYIL